MANKRRPKKFKAPYRHYGPSGIVTTKVSPNDFKSGKYYKSQDEDLFYTYSYGSKEAVPIQRSSSVPVATTNNALPMAFPSEIYNIILTHLAQTDGIKVSYMLVNRLWYKLCVLLLYTNPKLTSRNFSGFVESMTNHSVLNSLNYEITEHFYRMFSDYSHSLTRRYMKYSKTPLVKVLDLTNIIQAGKNSNITKILRRCSMTLTEIIAPQTSFGITSLSILKTCHNLVLLDLSLISETVNLLELFQSIKLLKHLKTLKFPRSSVNCDLNNDFSFQWPDNLQHLKLSGGITNEFIMDLQFPATVTKLEFQHCPLIKEYSIYYLLAKIGLGLDHLSVVYPMPSLKENSLDMVFKYCPFLTRIELYVDYVSEWCFNEINFPWIVDSDLIQDYTFNKFTDTKLQGSIIATTVNHFPFEEPQAGIKSLRKLNSMFLGSSGTLGQAGKIQPDDLIIALIEQRVPKLKVLQISNRVGWHIGEDSMSQLVDNLAEENDGGVYMCP